MSVASLKGPRTTEPDHHHGPGTPPERRGKGRRGEGRRALGEGAKRRAASVPEVDRPTELVWAI
jgi:hypothetical protein